MKYSYVINYLMVYKISYIKLYRKKIKCKKVDLKMEKLIEKSNLNVNFWLLKIGLMYGHLHDGIIQTTKFGILKCSTVFCFSIFTTIKWTIYLFCAKESRMCNLLGDWSYSYGPKLLVDLILLILANFVLFVFLLFYNLFVFLIKKS